ncbi:MAG: hypothetical protein JWO02_579 [Solirubrobacterales bacterium]|nr:hypothetical protein [Solirubrobacterales bacterium]
MTQTDAATSWGPLAQPLHTNVPDDPRPWRENAFFCFWDPAQDLTGIMHISASPNAKGGRRARVSVQLGAESHEVIETLGFDTFDSESITFHPESGFTIDSPTISGTISGTPLHARAVFAGETAPEAFSLDREHPIHHYQQSARVTGELTIGGRTITVDGHGYRDRTWGFRDESSSVEEYYGTMWVFPDFALSALRLLGRDGRAATLGYKLGADGSSEAVTAMSLVRDGAGLFVATRIETAGGELLDISLQERRATFWCPMGEERQDGATLSAYDELGRLRTADGVEGFGLLEQGITRKLF